MFIMGGMAYFVGCGDFLVYGNFGSDSYELRRVIGSDGVYIPVTTKNIKPIGEVDERECVDAANVLTKKRKNWLFGNNNASNSWVLDAKIAENTDVSIELRTKENNTNVVYLIENNDAQNKTKLYKTKKDGTAVTATDCGSVNCDSATISLSCSTAPQIEGLFNIEVAFCADEIDPEVIAKADCGELFSLGNGGLRLFVGGDYSKNICSSCESGNPN